MNGVPVPYLLFLCATVGAGVLVMIDYLRDSHHRTSLSKALSKVNTVIDGKRYVGCEAIAVRTLNTYADKHNGLTLWASHLCRTQSGDWFVLSFGVNDKKVVLTDSFIFAIHEDEARIFLETNPELYRLYFAAPAQA
jgi:hypothetical protein